MASLHFIITAPVLTRDGNELGRHVTLEVEVEGSAGIKSNAGLVRAARAICAGHMPAAYAAKTKSWATLPSPRRRRSRKARSPLYAAPIGQASRFGASPPSRGSRLERDGAEQPIKRPSFDRADGAAPYSSHKGEAGHAVFVF